MALQMETESELEQLISRTSFKALLEYVWIINADVEIFIQFAEHVQMAYTYTFACPKSAMV